MEFWCYKCGSKMQFTRAIGYYPLDYPGFGRDYDMEELWVCSHTNYCNVRYVFMDLNYDIIETSGFFI